MKNAIDNVNDETTELVVIPFALNHDGGITTFKATASESGKQKLKDQISSISPSKNSMTYHFVPLQDFYINQVDSSKVTYMFLMTDGQDEYGDKHKFPEMLQKWGENYGDKNVYGFYVMLHKSAQNKDIENICNTQKHLWKVETADINVNLTRLHNNAIFNARNDKYFDIPIYGKSDVTLNAKFENSSPYYVSSTSIQNGRLRVNVKFKGDVHHLPVSKVYSLHVEMKDGGQYDFLVNDVISVKCESKPERSLKINVK
ncbi:MAG: hypothetical protein NC453_09120 [Muribaculum sp.]|nr:hypothetical protein [Muribaculum sp.]